MKTTKYHFVKAMCNCGASKILRLVFLGAMLVTSHVTLADAELDRMKAEISKEAYVEVTTARDVQQQINKLLLADKRRAEAAIKVGAAYVKVYLHGAGSSCGVSDYWDAYMGGLTATGDAYDWVNNFCGGKNGFQNQHIEPLACSPATLVTFQFKDGGVLLEYRIIRIGGVTMDKYGPLEFIPQGAGDTRKFSVAINTNNRIYDIDPRGDPAEVGYVEIIDTARKGLKKLGLHGDAFPKEMKARYGQDKQLIQQIEQQVAQFCK